MGKQLIIKGADFSENGIAIEVNLTSRFGTWTSGTLDESALPKSSGVYALSNAVDVSAFVGRNLRFTNSAYRSNGGLQPGFYSWFFDSNGNPLPGIRSKIRVYDSGENGVGYTVVDEVKIPTGAATFKATYFDTTKSLAFTYDDFSCIVKEPE